MTPWQKGAARRACTALLAAQGIRPTADRGHETVEKAGKALESAATSVATHAGLWMRER